jgi:hypothetical protein
MLASSLRTLLALALVSACQPEQTTTPTDATPTTPSDAVPDDAYAIAGGVTIPRLAFDEAMAKASAGGPASRDDRGLRQRIGLALVTRELLRLELARLGAADGAEVAKRAGPLQAALERDAPMTVPTWWSMPPLSSDDMPGAIVVASEHLAPADDAALAAAYEQSKPRWTSEKAWVRLDSWTLRYDDSTGIPQCDAYIAKYRRCSAKFPAATQPNVIADLTRQANEWRSRAEDPEHRELLQTECEAAETEAMQQTHSMGCDWTSDAKSDEKKAIAARKAELKAIAEDARTRLGAGEDPHAIAEALGGVASAKLMVSTDELGKKVASATRGLAPGKTSKLVDDAGAWTVVRLVERHGAGTLPLEVVKSDVADDLRIRQLAAAIEALPATLRGKYEVKLHASVESLDAGP